MTEPLATIATYEFPGDADAAQRALASAGIESFLDDERKRSASAKPAN